MLTSRGKAVVFLPYPTSNRNLPPCGSSFPVLYFFLILHQTATTCRCWCHHRGCISSLSYIKPQQSGLEDGADLVVFLPYPTSNRNTSSLYLDSFWVVFLPYPTSNRNECYRNPNFEPLYFFLILHQTATKKLWMLNKLSCISSLSYIKPQPENVVNVKKKVVFLPYPTSNRNLVF